MFNIKKAVGSHCYEFELPRTMFIYQVIDVPLLDSAVENSFAEQIAPSPPSVELNGKEEYFMDEISNSRIFQQRL